MGRPTPLARTLDLGRWRNATDRDVSSRLHPLYAAALGRAPRGRQVFPGLPFDLGEGGDERWILLDGPVTIQVPDAGRASHLVVAHFSDTWRDDGGVRPPGVAVGHVIPVGEELARYTIRDAVGGSSSSVIRRRFEIADGILGWGSVAFAAVPHPENEVLDWRGPHPAQTPGRYAAIGHSGTLTVMPGTYGGSQTGMTDFVPSSSDDLLLWLHSIQLDPEQEIDAVILEPLAGGRPGSDVVVAALTLFNGSANPLVRSPRMQIELRDPAFTVEGGDRIAVDLGTVMRTQVVQGDSARARRHVPIAGDPVGPPVIGWGEPRAGSADDGSADDSSVLVDLSIAPDARLEVGEWTVTGRDLAGDAAVREATGSRSIAVLAPPVIPVEVEIVDGRSGERLPARVRFTAADGRYLPPVGHREEINPAFFEDTGGDLILGSAPYAYVPGEFRISLPAGFVDVEVVAGFDRAPYHARVEVNAATREIRVPLEHTIDLHGGRWVTSDSHVHFLAPSTALLQAAAEDVNVVNLLAAQWGNLYTNVTDLPWGSMADPSRRRIVVVGTENRQNVLGHLALLGAHRMTTPMASGGPPEGPMAGALEVLLADWADRCRAAGGLTVAAHFPLPYAEIAADIVSGRIEAVETQALSPGLDDPAVTEWYRFLNLGHRLPLVAGTDKMSTEVPVGAVRAYVHLLQDGELTFEAWADAVRAGRTFVTSGPILELLVDGHEPGDVISMSGPGRLEARVRARAAQPVIGDVELIVNGRVVARSSATPSTGELALAETIEIEAGSWIAARSRSPHHIESAFATSMAAHTSPVYVEVDDRPLRPQREDAAVVEQVMIGARTWVAELAAVAEPAERLRMLAFLDETLEQFRRRMADPALGVRSGWPPRT
jgi:hypothetical protein